MSRDLRRDLHAAYSYVRSTEYTKGAIGTSLNDVLEAHLRRLKPPPNAPAPDPQKLRRLTRLERLDLLVEDIDRAVSAVSISDRDPLKRDKLRALGVYEAIDAEFLPGLHYPDSNRYA